jgi:hypothetical protein
MKIPYVSPSVGVRCKDPSTFPVLEAAKVAEANLFRKFYINFFDNSERQKFDLQRDDRLFAEGPNVIR